MSASTDHTSQVAQSLPGFDAAPAIANLEQSLLGNLGTPAQQTLGELPLQQFSPSLAQVPQGSGNLAGLASQLDPFNLITPVINGLGTLGSGNFLGIDPTQILGGVSNAFEGTAPPLQQAAGSLANDWQGQSGTTANAKTRAAVANGADVGKQSQGLGNNLSTAASNVSQARQQMMDIIDEYHAKLAAADLSTPSGRAAAVAAANQATTESTALMQELQGNLGDQAQQVSAMGSPVGVTQAPTGDGSMLGGLGSTLGSLDPTGALSTVLTDPRLNPRSLAGNFMDLLFMPQTMMQLSHGMTQMNGTIGQTNSIMTGLGNTLHTTNGTIGHTNSIMTGLGHTLHTTNGTIGHTNSIMTGLGHTLDTTNSNLGQTNATISQTNSALGRATGAINNTTGALGETNRTMSHVNDTMGATNEQLGSTNQTMGNTNQTLGTTNRNLHDTNTELKNVNKLNPFAH